MEKIKKHVRPKKELPCILRNRTYEGLFNGIIMQQSTRILSKYFIHVY